MKKILITGAGGFLGRYLIEACFHKEFEIIAISSQKESLYKQFSGTDILVVDKLEALSTDWSKIDVLINCAFPRNVDGEKIAEGLEYVAKVLEKANRDGVGFVINISSQSVYSQNRCEAANENTSVCLDTKYAIGKYVTELMTNSICREIRHTNLRMASLIGPEFEQRLVNKFIKSALVGENLKLIGGKQRFGFLDVRDAAEAIVTIIEDNDELEEFYNLGIEKSYSIMELAETVVKQVNSCSRIEIKTSDLWQNSELDSHKLYERFKWKPSITLEESILYITMKEKGNKNEYLGNR